MAETTPCNDVGSLGPAGDDVRCFRCPPDPGRGGSTLMTSIAADKDESAAGLDATPGDDAQGFRRLPDLEAEAAQPGRRTTERAEVGTDKKRIRNLPDLLAATRDEAMGAMYAGMEAHCFRVPPDK